MPVSSIHYGIIRKDINQNYQLGAKKKVNSVQLYDGLESRIIIVVTPITILVEEFGVGF